MSDLTVQNQKVLKIKTLKKLNCPFYLDKADWRLVTSWSCVCRHYLCDIYIILLLSKAIFRPDCLGFGDMMKLLRMWDLKHIIHMEVISQTMEYSSSLLLWLIGI